MILHYIIGMIRLALVAISTCVLTFSQPLPDAKTLLARVEARMEQVAADTTNRYHYTRTNLLEELDASGTVKKQTRLTHLVLLRQGLPRARIVAVDDRALPESEQRTRRSTEERLQKTLAQDKNPDPNKPKAWLNEDITDHFDIVVTGRTNVGSRSLIIMTFGGRTNATANNMIERLINKLSGVLWIDEQEAEIAQLQVRLNEPMKFWGGLVGRLDQFDITMHRRRSEFGAWFTHLTTGAFNIRKLFSTTRMRFTEEAHAFAPGDLP